MYTITATVKNSPNEVPVATCTSRSFTVAMALARVLIKEGFEVKTTDNIEIEPKTYVGESEQDLRRALRKI